MTVYFEADTFNTLHAYQQNMNISSENLVAGPVAAAYQPRLDMHVQPNQCNSIRVAGDSIQVGTLHDREGLDTCRQELCNINASQIQYTCILIVSYQYRGKGKKAKVSLSLALDQKCQIIKF